MTSELPQFSLLIQPWVKVRLRTGEVCEVSLLELFERAGEIRSLAGELPSQDAAILRMLLAIILGATRPEYRRNHQDCIDLWDQWWKTGLPIDEISTYLDARADRFELFSESTPFMQVADLRTASGKASGLGKIIAEVPDGHQYFTTRGGAHVESLSHAEAARWLVHCQQFDPAGIKTGAVGDDRVKNGKGYSFGYPAWAGNIGVVILEGDSLAKTLLLNLPLQHSGPEDLPAWDRPHLTSAADEGHPVPAGPADAFTWQSRRIRLFPRGGFVVDVQISNGDRLAPQNLHELEPMSAWRYSKNQSKVGHPVLMPVTYSSSRLIWQGLSSLLATSEVEGSQARPPGAVGWLASLVDDGVVARGFPVTVRTVGVEYGSNNSVIDAVVDDALSAPVVALVDPLLKQAALDAAGRASRAVVALLWLSRDLDAAAGAKRDDKARDAAGQRVFEKGYAALDGPYRRWLVELTDPDRVLDLLQSWGERVYSVLSAVGNELVTAAGPEAWQGREVTEKIAGQPEQRVLMDSGRAYLKFVGALRKATGVGAQETSKESS